MVTILLYIKYSFQIIEFLLNILHLLRHIIYIFCYNKITYINNMMILTVYAISLNLIISGTEAALKMS